MVHCGRQWKAVVTWDQPLLAVPVRYLYADENADDDDDEVNRNGSPFLLPHMFDEPAQQHF